MMQALTLSITEPVMTAFLVAVLASAMPLLLAALGETVGEQSGVLNLGIEGLLLFGGYIAFAATLTSGSFWIGFAAGAVAGIALASIMVVLAVGMGANQIVVGLGISLAGTGLSSLLFDWNFSQSSPRLGRPEVWRVDPLAHIPVLGEAIFSQHGMLLVTLLLAVAVSLWLTRTQPGLRLRVAGRRPATLDAVGGSVRRTRSLAVLFGGAMAGLGGAYLALISAGTFTPAMTHGLGFLAIVVAMLARGRVQWVVLISLAYGLVVAGGTAVQLSGIDVSTDVITMVPFVAVLVMLVLFGRRGSALPAALATPYVRGER